MPCIGTEGLTEAQTLEREQRRKEALRKVERDLLAGRVKLVQQGDKTSFEGWSARDREGFCDACAYRALMAEGSSALRMAAARQQGTDQRRMQAR